jgi:hypothetical protein
MPRVILMPGCIEVPAAQIGHLPLLKMLIDDTSSGLQSVEVIVPEYMCASVVPEFLRCKHPDDFVLDSETASMQRATLDWLGVDCIAMRSARELREEMRELREEMRLLKVGAASQLVCHNLSRCARATGPDMICRAWVTRIPELRANIALLRNEARTFLYYSHPEFLHVTDGVFPEAADIGDVRLPPEDDAVVEATVSTFPWPSVCHTTRVTHE